MLPQFGAATADSLIRASSIVSRIGTDAHLYDDPDDVNISSLLDSRFDSEKCEALKRLIALIAQGVDVCNFFPQVVKNVASHSLELKKLVYLYLLHYAEKRPNEALLSINCFQKDLSDLNPLVRAWALRAMAGIHLHIVAPLVLSAIKKCARDPSAYVRKCAASALCKLSDLLQEENTDLEELVDFFLIDHSHGVVGAAAVAFKAICPNKLSLIGKHFRRLCDTLPDIEEWAQVSLIEILLRYVIARHGLGRGSIMFPSISAENHSHKHDNHVSSNDSSYGFKLNTSMLKSYIDGWEEILLEHDQDGANYVDPTSIENDDAGLLLKCTLPLLWSQNSGVVLAAAGVHWIMAPIDEIQRIVKPILFLLRSFPASKYVVLCNIQVFAKELPSIFATYYEDFFVHSFDIYQIKALKLEILSAIATNSSIQFILEEFQDYLKDTDRRFAADTVAAIGLCAQRLPSVVDNCLEGLLSLASPEMSPSNVSLDEREACILVQAIMSIRLIIKHSPAKHEKVIARLARNLDVIKEPAARALLIWIVGEYCSIGHIIPSILPTILKYLAWSFPSEVLEAKHQILNTAVKVVLSSQTGDRLMFDKILSYTVQLAKYDSDYDIRDRARMIENLISPPELQNGDTAGELFEIMFIKNTHLSQNFNRDFRFYLPGSLSHVVLHAAPGYNPLPKPGSLYDNSPNGKIDDRSSTNSFDSGSSIDESDSYNDSEPSVESGENESDSSLITNIEGYQKENSHDQTSGSRVFYDEVSRNLIEDLSASTSSDLVDIMSKTAFESWLDENSGSSSIKPSDSSSAIVVLNNLSFDVSPKLHSFLDPINGNGLRIDYSFSSHTSELFPSVACIELQFWNCSNEVLANIVVEDGVPHNVLKTSNQVMEEIESLPSNEEGPAVSPIEKIATLDPGQTIKRSIQVRFHHHLLPLEMAVQCNGRRHMAKLWPDIGYFVRPLSINAVAFVEMESRLKGMFECTKRCLFEDHIESSKSMEQSSPETETILAVSRSLASRVLSNANAFLVSVDMPVSFTDDDASGLRLRFAGQICRTSMPCLISILAEGKCSEPLDLSVKINCEDAMFGLNLLNKFVAFLH